MRADTQFSVVEAALKGYQKWIIAHGRSPQQDVRSTPSFPLFHCVIDMIS